MPKIQKAVYALNCGFEQKTQVTEQLLIIEKTITDDKAKQVFWSHMFISAKDHTVRRLIVFF